MCKVLYKNIGVRLKQCQPHFFRTSEPLTLIISSLYFLQDPRFAGLLLDKLQALEWPPRGQGAESCCDMCGTPLHQLRRLALHSALGLALDGTPNLQSGPFSGLLAPHQSASSQRPSWVNQGSSSATIRQPSRYHVEPVAGIQNKEMGWIKSGAAGMDIKPSCHATVTPLPTYAQQYLEGVWSVTTISRAHQQQQSQVRTRTASRNICPIWTRRCPVNHPFFFFLHEHLGVLSQCMCFGLEGVVKMQSLTNHSPKLYLGACL